MAIDHDAQAKKVKSKLADFGHANVSYNAPADIANYPHSPDYRRDADDIAKKPRNAEVDRMPDSDYDAGNHGGWVRGA